MLSKITKDMPIAEILAVVPDSVELMIESGLHCFGCGSNGYETLEQGMLGHGFAEDEIEDLVHRINLLNVKEEEVHKPQEEDFKAKKVKEGDVTYYKVAGMLFTLNGYKALHRLADKAGLQIRVEAGGCSGYSNTYDFKDAPKQDEKVYKLSKDLAIYMNDFSFNKLYSCIVDFESGLRGAGLTFDNPNVKGSCSCGHSWSF